MNIIFEIITTFMVTEFLVQNLFASIDKPDSVEFYRRKPLVLAKAPSQS